MGSGGGVHAVEDDADLVLCHAAPLQHILAVGADRQDRMVMGGEDAVEHPPDRGLLGDQMAGEDDPGLAAEELRQDGDVIFPGILGVDHIIRAVFYDLCQLFGGGQIQDVFHGELVDRDAETLHFFHKGTVNVVAKSAVCLAALVVPGQQLHIPL